MVVELYKLIPMVVQVDMSLGRVTSTNILLELAGEMQWEPLLTAVQAPVSRSDGKYTTGWMDWRTASDDEFSEAVRIADRDMEAQNGG